jgi:hypothetical protein
LLKFLKRHPWLLNISWTHILRYVYSLAFNLVSLLSTLLLPWFHVD